MDEARTSELKALETNHIPQPQKGVTLTHAKGPYTITVHGETAYLLADTFKALIKEIHGDEGE